MGDVSYPFVIKPRYGSGSIGLALIRNSRMLETHFETFDEEMVAQEYINAGENEFTCGLAFTKDGKLLETIILQRELKKGFTKFAEVVQRVDVNRQIREIAAVLEGRGAYNIQGRLTDKGFVVFEINPRFSGTTAFRAVAGLNEPDLYIQHYLYGHSPGEVTISPLYMMRYLNECYVDPDQVAGLKTSKKINKRCGFTIDYF